MKFARYVIALVPALLLLTAGAAVSTSAQTRVVLVSETREHTAAALERPAHLAIRHVGLSDALTRLHQSSGVPISFSPSLLPKTHSVSCACEAATVAHALDLMLRGTRLRYREIDGHVLVYGTPLPEMVEPQLELMQPRYASQVAAPAGPRVGTITGTVHDANTLEPIGGAQVVLPELDRGTLTQNDGRYLLTDVPAGVHQLEVLMIGYRSLSQEVQVADDQTARADFQLTTRAIALDEVVVTGVGIREERRRLGSSSTIVRSQAFDETSAETITQALNGQVPGVLTAPRGETGMGQPIRIRGGVSLTQRNAPLVYVDGVRVEGGHSPAYRLSVATSRLNDLNPHDIERVEVIKGAAAATLFGTEASSGVIQIFTKRGIEGAPRYSFGIHQEALRFPPNRLWPTAGYDRENDRIEYGTGAQDYMQTGHNQSYNLSVSGGSESVRYYASGRAMAENGYFPNQEVTNWSARTNLDFTHTEKLQTSLGLNFRRNQTVFPVRLGWVGLHTLSDPRAKTETAPYGDGSTGGAFHAEGLLTRNIQTVNALTIDASAVYQWSPGIVSRLVVGIDRTEQGMEGGVEDHPDLIRFTGGYRTLDRGETRAITADFHTALERQLARNMTASLVIGGQSFWETREGQFVDVSQFPAPGLFVVQSASNLRNVEEWWEYVVNAGAFAQAQVGLWDQLFLTGGIRVDGNSTFGEDFGLQTYPKAGISYVLSDASFWPSNTWWNTLRLRAAYGVSGLQPGAFDAVRSYAPSLALDNVIYMQPANVGSPDLRPERSIEREFGADMAFLNDRLGLELTYYSQKTVDAIMERPLAASLGFMQPQVVNLGEMKSSGLELSLDWNIVQRPNFGWNLRTMLSTFDQKVTDMGIPNFRMDVGGRELNWIRVGYMPGANFGPIADPNNPYTLEVPLEELTRLEQVRLNLLQTAAGTDSLVFLGNTQPSFTGSLSTDFTLPGGFSLSALFTGSTGFVVNSETMAIMWTNGTTPRRAEWERDLANPNTSLERRQQIVDEYVEFHPGTFASFLADGDHLRFQELSLSYDVPSSVVERIGLSNLTVALQASNLKLWLTERYRQLGAPGDPGQERGRSLAGSVTGHPNSREVTEAVFLATDQWQHPAPQRLGITFRGTW